MRNKDEAQDEDYAAAFADRAHAAATFRAIGSLSEQWQRFAESLISQRRQIRGLPVRVVNTRRDIDTTQVFERLTQALDLIAIYAPRWLRRLQQDFAGIVFIAPPGLEPQATFWGEPGLS